MKHVLIVNLINNSAELSLWQVLQIDIWKIFWKIIQFDLWRRGKAIYINFSTFVFFLDGFLSQSALDILEILQNILNKIFVLILTNP